MTQTPLRPARAPAPEPMLHPRKWPWVAGGVLTVVLAGGAGVYAMTAASPEPAVDPVTAGPFAVTVTGTRCGVAEVGPADLQQPAKGRFCLVDVAVRNTGAAPELFDGGAQQALDDRGGAHLVADRASVFLNDGQSSLLDEIPAGATVNGVLPFDVPAGARLTTLVVHASMGGTAVRVPLS